MVCAAPDFRAIPGEVGGLEGGDGMPVPTSGPPLDPESPRSVLEAREGARSGAHRVRGRADVGGGRGR
jgi:hypothetical protein